MKIVDERVKKLIRFGDLFGGDLFSANGDPAMKLADNKAVVLTDGNYVARKADDYVEIIYGELVIS